MSYYWKWPLMKWIFLPIIFALCSCSGYRVRYHKNPFLSYGIKTIAVPMFTNQTIFPDVVGPFTQHVSLQLASLANIRVIPGESKNADAVLVGIVRSPSKRREAVIPQTREEISGVELGQRKSLFLPSRIRIPLEVKLILIKNPSPEQLIAAQGPVMNYMVKDPKVIFATSFMANIQYNLPLSADTRNYSDEIYDDLGRVVNFSRAHGSFYKELEGEARSVADSFRRTVLYAF